MWRVEFNSGFGQANRFALCRQHTFVNFTLRFGEFAINRERARDVTRVVAVLSARINQAQIAVFQLGQACAIVQAARIRTRSDDAVIRHLLRTGAHEFMTQFRLQVQFAPADAAFFHRTDMAQCRNFTRRMQPLLLNRILAQTHFVQNRIQIMLNRRCAHATTHLRSGGIQSRSNARIQ